MSELGRVLLVALWALDHRPRVYLQASVLPFIGPAAGGDGALLHAKERRGPRA